MTVDRTTFGLPDREKDDIIADAETSLGRDPEERYRTFCSIQRMVAATWEGLTEDEMWRKLTIGEQLDQRPDPWWKNIRREALP